MPHPLPPGSQPLRRRPEPGVVGVRRSTLAGAAATGAVLLAWAVGATCYVASRDEVSLGFFATETEMRYVYEDRIAELKGRLEREITQNLVERNGYAARAEALVRRQGEIEARQAWLGGLAERLLGREATAGGDGWLPPPSHPAAKLPASGEVPPKPTPLADPASVRPTGAGADGKSPERTPDRLSRLEQGLADAAAHAVRTADLIRRVAGDRSGRLRLAVEGTRLDLSRFAPPRESAAGGPFVPASASFDSPLFAATMRETDAAVGDLERWSAWAQTLPLAKPLPRLEQSSGFGYRLDPFTRSPAMHTGLDFTAEHGSVVRATAGGRVVTAEYSAGYGNLVEIDHGNGLATRYGHLSGFQVPVGATVTAGQIVGRVGATGRATGPHLHYEVRLEGEAVNPTRFLEAGRLLDTAVR